MKALNNLTMDQVKNGVITALIGAVFYLVGASGAFINVSAENDSFPNHQFSQFEGELITIGDGHPGYDGD